MPAFAPKTLAEALLKVQAAAVTIQKDAINPRFGSGYISLDALLPQILPVLTSAGLVLSQVLDHVNGARAVRTRLTHASTGEWMEGSFPLPNEIVDPQKIGAAVTYFKRYAVLAFLGLTADRDDDANTVAAARPTVAYTLTAPNATTNAGLPSVSGVVL